MAKTDPYSFRFPEPGPASESSEKRLAQQALFDFNAGRYKEALEKINTLPDGYYAFDAVMVLIELFGLRKQDSLLKHKQDSLLKHKIEQLQKRAVSDEERIYIDGMLCYMESNYDCCLEKLKPLLGTMPNNQLIANRIAISHAILNDYTSFDSMYDYMVTNSLKTNRYVNFYHGVSLVQHRRYSESKGFFDIESPVPFIKRESLRYRMYIAVREKAYAESFRYYKIIVKDIWRKK
ncbi:MAG: hypothetical protein QM758_29700 [Armatimonas sp.]